MSLPPVIPFPGSLEALGVPALLAALGAAEYGAAARLLEESWLRQEPACSLPDDDSFLAAVARTTSQEWTAMRPRLLLALAATGCTPGGPPHEQRLLLERARGVFDARTRELDSELSRRRRRTAAATAAAAAARCVHRPQPPTDPSRVRDGSVTDRRDAAPSLRSDSSALPLNRSQQSANPGALNGAPEEEREDVIACLGEGAGAILADRVVAWLREKSLSLLQEAFARWAHEGLTTVPISKASELARGPHAHPARVQYLIEDADGKIAASKASKGERGGGKWCNPVGVVIHGLGASDKSRGRPAEIPLFIEQRWARLQASTLQVLQAQAAIAAKVQAAKKASGPAAGVRA